MIEINLKSNGNYEEIILNYLKANASDTLAEKINSGAKTLAQCWNYIMSEARKHAKNGCACIEDSKVYGWAIHFFEEESINGADYTSANSGVKAVKTASEGENDKTEVVDTPKETKKPKARKIEAPSFDQISFDSLFG